ncbi:menaquinone biosynthetic enzyme MqnA/MqnD family protein [Flavihumibacter sp.]|uniref:menaquinone biosynthetic enzyme MqnA/MqnD family protein n=1 Tax=Flavihumibacter sp. TaxID=1913981 RepID=UPI002FCB08ED
MDRKIRVGAVSYLNTKPLIYGLERGMLQDEITLEMDFPANIAGKLLDDSIDIGLVPVAIIPRLRQHHFVADYGICCDGPVASVCLFSEVPVEAITEVLLDYQSRTSVRLARILMKEFWKIDPVITDTRDDFRERITGTTAGVVIGDRALEQRSRSRYVYDLGEAWKLMTGLPFVFAGWISNKPISTDFIAAFNEANEYGLNRLEEVITEHPYPAYDLHKYYTEDIIYKLDTEKMKGLELYLDYLQRFGFQVK